MPNHTQYEANLGASTQGKIPFAIQSDAPRSIAELIAGVPEQALQERPLPDKWSVGEIIAHLAEDELVSSWRYRQMIDNSGCVLSVFDQDVWAPLGFQLLTSGQYSHLKLFISIYGWQLALKPAIR